MVTIRDIAREAGVSMATVSYVLNNSGNIAESTRERVREVANRLGYRPSGAARSLRSSKTGNIGVYLPGFSGPVFGDILQSIYDAISVLGYEILVCSTQLSERLLVERHVDGAIILNSFISDDVIAQVQSPAYPVVVMERIVEMPNVSCVVADNVQGGYLAIRHLLETGRCRIAIICGHAESHENSQRLEGARHALEEAGINISSVPVVHGGFSEELAGYAMSSILQDDSTIDGVFCLNDEMGIGAINAILRTGKSVPRDVSVIGFDDIPVANYINPSLSTIRIDKAAWGHHAATTLVDMIENGTSGRLIKLPVKLVTRQSSAGYYKAQGEFR
jgi:LacI family transcriptional regulator